MSIADLLRLVGLAACWGLAFVFIRVAVPALGAFALVEIRSLLACGLLLGYARYSGVPLRMREHWPHYLVLGACGSAIPFCMVAFAQTVQSASYSVIIVALAPMISAMIAAVWLGDRFTARKGLGLLLGIAGVVLLMGWSPSGTAAPPVWAGLLTLGAAGFYGLASCYAKRYTSGIAPLAMASGSQAGAALLLIPFAIAFPPVSQPGLVAWFGVLALAVFSSALAFMLYFRLVAAIGPVRTVSVNFITPLFGVGGGVLLLDESLTLNMLVGAAVIFAALALLMTQGRGSGGH